MSKTWHKVCQYPRDRIPVSKGNVHHLKEYGSNTVFVLMIGEQYMELETSTLVLTR